MQQSKKITVDYGMFAIAVGHPGHGDAMQCPQKFYLNREDGSVHFYYEDDSSGEFEMGLAPKDNQAQRQEIESWPERYIEIPSIGRDGDDEMQSVLRHFMKRGIEITLV